MRHRPIVPKGIIGALSCALSADVQALFHDSIAKWVVLNSKRAVTVLNPYRLGHHKLFTPKQGHPAHAKPAHAKT